MELLPQDELRRVEAQQPGPLAPLPREKVHTAALCDTNTRCAILAKFVSGKSRKAIARDLAISRNTVAAVIAQAEAEGELVRTRDRMARLLEGVLEDRLIDLAEGSEKMSSVDFGIYFDKWERLSGAAVTRVDVVLRREDGAAVLEDLQRLSAGIIDVEEIGKPTPP